MTAIRKSAWNTYATTCFDHQAGTDPRAMGGVQHHQVRFFHGKWQKRTVDSNGRFSSAGKPIDLEKWDGEERFSRIK